MKRTLLSPFGKCMLLFALTTTSFFILRAQSPGGINAGIKVWLRAGAGTSTTANGAAVSAWNDQSGGGRNHTQTDPAKQPVYVGAGGAYLMNYQPAVRFAGLGNSNAGNDFLSVPNYLAATDAYHVFIVTRLRNLQPVTTYSTSYGFYADYLNTSWQGSPCTPSSYVAGNHYNNSNAGSNYGILSYITPKTGTQRLIWNGTATSWGAISYSITTAVSPTFTLGADRNNTDPVDGDIQEVIVYAGASGADMTSAQISQIQSYLAIKYGISLSPAGQPNYTASDGSTQFWTGASNSGYQNHIFGLGRDDNSSLYQKQAFSYGDSSLSVYLNGALGALNSDNEGTIATDKSFLMLGDNNLSGYANTINYASGAVFLNGSSTSDLNALSNRIWKAQTTTQGSWTVDINVNKYATATVLLVSSTTSFSLATTRIYPITAGKASNVTLNNGEYMALARFASGPGGVSANLATWLRADAGTSTTVNGAAVTSWGDQSGYGRTHTQANASKQPKFAGAGSSYLMNYNPALQFDGDDDVNAPSQYLNATDAYHVFSVSRINGAGATAWQSVASFYVDNNHSDWYLQQASCRTGAVEKNNTTKTVNYALASSLMPKTGNQTVIWNGTPQTFANTAYTLNYCCGPYNVYSIGSDAGTDYLNGDIQEVIIYGGPNVTMAAGDVARIQSYLAIKYGISLDAAGQPDYTASDGSTKFWTGASNSGYQNHIFGLGRDDNSGLSQAQAFSYGDSSISIYLGASLGALNSLNGTTIASNYSFLMLGDNNLTGFTSYGSYPAGTTFGSGSSAGIINARTARIWKAQTTTQASWTININTNKYGPGSDASSSVFVMVSSSAAFTPAVTRLYQVVNGTANDVTVNDGEYMAIGAFIKAPGGVSDQLALWTRADDAGAAPSAAWKDHSPNNNPVEVTGTMSLSAANASHNYNPYYGSFSAANHFYDAASSINTTGVVLTDVSLFSVIRPDASAPGALAPGSAGRIAGIDDDITYAAEPGFSLASNKSLVFYKFTATEDWKYSTATTTASKSSVVSFNASNTVTAASALKIALDGNETSLARAGTYNYVSNKLRIGYGAWYGTFFPGDIMEVAWYNKSLTADESSRVTSYLAIKNGVTLGSNATAVNYVNTAGSVVWTGSSTFQNNIAGIGRDELEGLMQKQSVSVNPHPIGQVTVSLGNMAASNAANMAVFNKDNSYLIWGDNGDLTSLATGQTAFNYDISSVNLRMNRRWMVQATGFDQPVSINIPAAMIGAVTTSDCQKLRLIVSSDAGFATIVDATTNLTLNGGVYTCFYKFPAGTSYFTFGRIEIGAPGTVFLPATYTPSACYNTCEELGWRYFYADGTQGLNNGTKKLFAIHRNGNGTATTLDNFTGALSYQNGSYEKNDGVNASHVMGRTLTINDPSAGNYTVNGGMKVRMYIDSSELNSAVAYGATTKTWFKHPGDLTALLVDQTTEGVDNAMVLTPSGSAEDSVAYVEFSGIQHFSTFGFMSSTEFVVLPLDVLNFTATLSGTTATVKWTTDETGIAYFELERSVGNSATFVKVRTIQAMAGSTGIYAVTDDVAGVTGKVFYRLRVVGDDGKYKYSTVKSVALNGMDKGIRVNPSPFSNRLKLLLSAPASERIIISLLDSKGGLILKERKTLMRGQNSFDLPVPSVAHGLYLLLVQHENGVIEKVKLIH